VNKRGLDVAFAALGGLLVLFVLLPLGSILLTLDPGRFWLTLIDTEVLRSIGLKVLAAAIATVVALFTGVPLAYVLARRRFAGKRLIEALIDLPIVLPHTAAGVALLLVWGRRGLVGRC
jgi:molybdate/tungstate transport system permease protein